MAAAWGALVGGFLQFGIQLPWVLKLDRDIRFGGGCARACVQGGGAQRGPRDPRPRRRAAELVRRPRAREPARDRRRRAAALRADALRAARELVRHEHRGRGAARARARARGRGRRRCASAYRRRCGRVAFFVVPSFVAFVLLGDVLVAGIYRAGEFGAADVTARVAHARGLQRGADRVHEHAHLPIRVLRVARHEDARARRGTARVDRRGRWARC